MFLIIGTFAIVVLMLFIGLIGEMLGSMFSKTEDSADQVSAEESFSEYATAQ